MRELLPILQVMLRAWLQGSCSRCINAFVIANVVTTSDVIVSVITVFVDTVSVVTVSVITETLVTMTFVTTARNLLSASGGSAHSAR
jgi:hypothetical protein